MIVVPLSTPLRTAGGEIKQLDLRTPTARDVVDLSAKPIVADRIKYRGRPAAATGFDRHLAFAWLERLSGIPAEDLSKLSLRDGGHAARAVCDLVNAFLKAHPN